MRRRAKAVIRDITARLERACRFLAPVRSRTDARSVILLALFTELHLNVTTGGTYNNASSASSEYACAKVEPGFWAPTGSAAPLECPASGFR